MMMMTQIEEIINETTHAIGRKQSSRNLRNSFYLTNAERNIFSHKVSFKLLLNGEKSEFCDEFIYFFSIFRSGLVSQKYDTDGDWKEICVKVEKLNIANEEDF